MKKFLLVLVLLVALYSCQSFKKPQGIPGSYRLIQTSENNATWMSPENAEEIQECGKKTHKHGSGYFDITDYPSLGKVRVPTPAPLPSPCQFNDAVVEEMISEINMTNWINTVTSLQNFGTRYYTNIKGKEAAEQIQNWTAIICGEKCSSVLFQNTWLQPSVIVTIPGEGELASQHVVIGAHLDSTATSTANAPGADDDASGVAVLIETLNVLIQVGYKPKRTLVFQFYAAEEVGLRGSQAIVDQYVKNNIDVYAMVQFDMVGYSRTNPIFITDYVSTELTTCLRQLAAQFKHHPTWGSSSCGYGCSDHASFTKAGYRSSFPFETSFSSSNPYIHTANDKIANLTPSHARLFIELSLAAVETLA
eukprot:TRINITY_DN34_c1_g1_i1.p1 TRINITY_DN34_c1_g1~~TRINITY_DN34_c1_g1_i1.p1  ORF type:complete len:364 (-),score=110.68 TRINITY_DN34_c1_g1_i1:65-1156(-)